MPLRGPFRFVPECCGLRGIVARIHFKRLMGRGASAVAWGIVARIHCSSGSVASRNRCGLQSSLDTLGILRGIGPAALWLAGNRRSDTLNRIQIGIPLCCGLRESSLGYTFRLLSLSFSRLWLAGNRRSDTLWWRGPSTRTMLWLAGNRRSDTLGHGPAGHGDAVACGNRRSDTLCHHTGRHQSAVACGNKIARIHSAASLNRSVLWLAGNRRSDTLPTRPSRGTACCGLRGIVARIHSPREHERVVAVACGESSLGYTDQRGDNLDGHAVALRNRRSDTLKRQNLVGMPPAVACGESSLGYMKRFWSVGMSCGLRNRRSDTLAASVSYSAQGCGLRESSLGYTSPYGVWRRRGCGLRGIVARIHFPLGVRHCSRCGLRGIVARIHCPSNRAGTSSAVACGESSLGYTLDCAIDWEDNCCGLRGIVARIHYDFWNGSAFSAVACGESSLGYTTTKTTAFGSRAVACGESSLGHSIFQQGHRLGAACGESSLGYTPSSANRDQKRACGTASLRRVKAAGGLFGLERAFFQRSFPFFRIGDP